ncbi:hypothetical protein JOL62DRAFT_87845 [Phyllosticta paracitricarpa]|uniref:Uncharacterized protein n=1 Tax=Phyllosticta paracitricarpa TaxID=2016321 RepID=A0ABR1N9N3_9PEZI
MRKGRARYRTICTAAGAPGRRARPRWGAACGPWSWVGRVRTGCSWYPCGQHDAGTSSHCHCHCHCHYHCRAHPLGAALTVLNESDIATVDWVWLCWSSCRSSWPLVRSWRRRRPHAGTATPCRQPLNSSWSSVPRLPRRSIPTRPTMDSRADQPLFVVSTCAHPSAATRTGLTTSGGSSLLHKSRGDLLRSIVRAQIDKGSQSSCLLSAFKADYASPSCAATTGTLPTPIHHPVHHAHVSFTTRICRDTLQTALERSLMSWRSM